MINKISKFVDNTTAKQNGFIVSNDNCEMSRKISSMFDGLPIIILNSSLEISIDVDVILLFIQREKYYSINRGIFESLGLEVVDVVKRRISGSMMYMLIMQPCNQ